MASVRKRKWTHKGVEREAWVVAYTDQSGARRLKTFDRRKEADDYRLQVEVELRAGNHIVIPDKMKVKDALDLYRKATDRRVDLKEISKTTASAMKRSINLIQEHIGGMKLNEFNQRAAQEVVDQLRLAGFGPNSVRHHAAILVRFVAFCKRQKLISDNFLRDDPLKLPRGHRRTDIPTRSDIEILTRCIWERPYRQSREKFYRLQVAVTCGLFGGMRPGEIAGLLWENVDFENNIIRIRHSYSFRDGLKSPKTTAGVREIPMAPPVRQALMNARNFRLRWLQAAQDIGECKTHSERCKKVSEILRTSTDANVIEPDFDAVLTGPVCVSFEGKHVSTQHLTSAFTTFLVSIGIVDPKTNRARFTLHALRHAFASMMIHANLPVMQISKVIGHAKPTTTLNVYGHVFPEDERIAQTIALAAEGAARQERDKAI